MKDPTYIVKVINLSDIPEELRIHAEEMNEDCHTYYMWNVVGNEDHELNDWFINNNIAEDGENILIFMDCVTYA